MTVDEGSKTKDNNDVSPASNIVDNGVAPGPQGIVGVAGSDNNVVQGDDGVAGDDSGGDNGGGNVVVESSGNEITGDVVKNSDNFIKRLFSWLF